MRRDETTFPQVARLEGLEPRPGAEQAQPPSAVLTCVDARHKRAKRAEAVAAKCSSSERQWAVTGDTVHGTVHTDGPVPVQSPDAMTSHVPNCTKPAARASEADGVLPSWQRYCGS